MTWNVLDYGTRRRTVEIWSSTAGVTLSNANGKLLTTAGSDPCYFTPSGTYSAGTTVIGETGALSAETDDTFTQGPFQRKHIFRIPTDSCDRLFIEWRGEVVSDSTGFSLQGTPGADYGPAYWWSEGGAWACGTVFDNPTLGSSYLNEPPVVCYNSAQYGSNSSVLAGNTYTPTVAATDTTTDPWGLIGGMALVVRSFQTNDTATSSPYAGPVGDQTNFAHRAVMGKLPNDGGCTGPISQGGLLWGYSYVALSVGLSRYPKQGDRLGWVYEIGYPKGFAAYNQSSSATPILIEDLSVSGLVSVYCAFYEQAPATGSTATQRYLKFDSGGGASMVVRGTLRAIQVYDGDAT